MNAYRLYLASMLVVSLAACGAHTDTQAPQAAQTPKDQIAALEAQGQVPTLDRTPGLAGIDTDANGVRDDIDRRIAAMPLTAQQKTAVTQLARALQTAVLVDTGNPDALRKASVDISRAGQCLHFRRVDNALRVITAIESTTANTRQRSMQYIRFNNALSGSVSSLLSGDTCDE
jgi:hypothetical protein